MISIVNHFPGRIRLKEPELAYYRDVGKWIKQTIIGMQGIQDVRVNEAACSIVVEYDRQVLNAKTLQARIQALDLNAAVPDPSEYQYTRGDVAANVICTLATLLLPNYLGAMSTAVLIAPTLAEGVKEISAKKLSVEVLDAVALGLSYSRGDYKTAMMTQTFISFGEYMEQQTNRNSDRLLAELMQPVETEVWRIADDGEKQKVFSNQLKPGDTIELMPGDAVPADGKVIAGAALVNQASLTGESVPVRRECDAFVYSGTSIHDGSIKVCVEKVGSEATTAKIAKLIFTSFFVMNCYVCFNETATNFICRPPTLEE